MHGVFSRELNSMNTLEICAVISLISFFNITSARPRPRERSPHIFSDYLGDQLPSTNYDRYDLVKNRFANDERAVVLVLPDDQLDKILIGNVDDNDQQWNRSTFWKLSGLQKVSTTEDVASLEEETTTDLSTEEIEICQVHFCDNLKTSSAMTTTEETTIQTTDVATESTTEEQTSEPKTEETTTEETTIQTTEVTKESTTEEQINEPKTEETTTIEETTMQTTEVTTESIFQEQTSESKAEETTKQTTVVTSETSTQNAETTEITGMEKGKMKPAILPVTEHVAKMKSNEQSLSTMDSLKLPTEIPCLCEILDFVDSLFDNIIKQMALLVENSEDKQEQEMINRLVYKKNKIIERYRPRTQCRSVFSKDQVADFAGCFDPLVAYAGARKDK
ncbi:hypothetical protein ACOME3_004728 [Neoechinorhynchus agilis]